MSGSTAPRPGDWWSVSLASTPPAGSSTPITVRTSPATNRRRLPLKPATISSAPAARKKSANSTPTTYPGKAHQAVTAPAVKSQHDAARITGRHHAITVVRLPPGAQGNDLGRQSDTCSSKCLQPRMDSTASEIGTVLLFGNGLNAVTR